MTQLFTVVDVEYLLTLKVGQSDRWTNNIYTPSHGLTVKGDEVLMLAAMNAVEKALVSMNSSRVGKKRAPHSTRRHFQPMLIHMMKTGFTEDQAMKWMDEFWNFNNSDVSYKDYFAHFFWLHVADACDFHSLEQAFTKTHGLPAWTKFKVPARLLDEESLHSTPRTDAEWGRAFPGGEPGLVTLKPGTEPACLQDNLGAADVANRNNQASEQVVPTAAPLAQKILGAAGAGSSTDKTFEPEEPVPETLLPVEVGAAEAAGSADTTRNCGDEGGNAPTQRQKQPGSCAKAAVQDARSSALGMQFSAWDTAAPALGPVSPSFGMAPSGVANACPLPFADVGASKGLCFKFRQTPKIGQVYQDTDANAEGTAADEDEIDTDLLAETHTTYRTSAAHSNCLPIMTNASAVAPLGLFGINAFYRDGKDGIQPSATEIKSRLALMENGSANSGVGMDPHKPLTVRMTYGVAVAAGLVTLDQNLLPFEPKDMVHTWDFNVCVWNPSFINLQHFPCQGDCQRFVLQGNQRIYNKNVCEYHRADCALWRSVELNWTPGSVIANCCNPDFSNADSTIPHLEQFKGAQLCDWDACAKEYQDVYLAGHPSDLFGYCTDPAKLARFGLCPLWLQVPWTRFLYLNTANGNHRLLAATGCSFERIQPWLGGRWLYRTGVCISCGFLQFDGKQCGPNTATQADQCGLFGRHPSAGIHHDLCELWNALPAQAQLVVEQLIANEVLAHMNENENEIQQQPRFLMTGSLDRYVAISSLSQATMASRIDNFCLMHQKNKSGKKQVLQMKVWTEIHEHAQKILKTVIAVAADPVHTALPKADERGWRYSSEVILFYVQHLDGSALTLECHTGGIRSRQPRVKVDTVSRVSEIMCLVFTCQPHVLAFMKWCLSQDGFDALFAQATAQLTFSWLNLNAISLGFATVKQLVVRILSAPYTSCALAYRWYPPVKLLTVPLPQPWKYKAFEDWVRRMNILELLNRELSDVCYEEFMWSLKAGLDVEYEAVLNAEYDDQ